MQESVFETVFNMFHLSPDARPSSSKIVGQFRYLLGRFREAR